jgi:hypothetical protein
VETLNEHPRDQKTTGPGLEIVTYSKTIQDRSRAWTTLEAGELRRRAVEAARDRDLETLWAITEAHLGLMGQPSVHTLRAYKTGLSVTLEALSGENVLRPAKNWGLRFIRELEMVLKGSRDSKNQKAGYPPKPPSGTQTP